MRTYEQDLADAAAYHGHVCSGQILGVRMARMACRILGIDDPRTSKRLVVFIECDRCLTDAIGTVTGCKLGKRTLKWMDFGKSAATFVDLQENRAIRLRRIYKELAPEGVDLNEYYGKISDEELFGVEEVEVSLKPGDLPGPPSDVQVCECCGEEILDGKQVVKNGKILCRSCAGQCYYKKRQ